MNELAVVIPKSVPAARKALAEMEIAIDSAETYAELRNLERRAEAIKALYREYEVVKRDADRVILIARHRTGEELRYAPANHGGDRRSSSAQSNLIATLAQQVGSPQRGVRLKQLAEATRDEMLSAAARLWEAGKEATRIVMQALRRSHEIIEDMRQAGTLAKGTRGTARGTDSSGGVILAPPEESETTLASVGIDKNLAKEIRRIGAMAEARFQKELARAAEIMELLSVSRDTVERWTKDARAAEKKAQQDRAWDLWLDCFSYRQIAEQIGVDDKTVAAWCSEFAASADFSAPPDSRQHFDVWTFAKTDGDESGFFGRMPPQVIENLLWFFTAPGEIVVDLFAGSGTTIDVAKRGARAITDYDPEKGLQTIVVAEAAEKHWARAKDAEQLLEAVEAKLKAQREYIIWRDSVVKHGGDRKSKFQDRNLDPLPAADPGDVTAHRWRKKLSDEDAFGRALAGAQGHAVSGAPSAPARPCGPSSRECRARASR